MHLCVFSGACAWMSTGVCCVHVVHGWHCLYPGAVLPVRSQVIINLDSGKQITRPRLPHIHPSKGFQRQPSTRITHSHAATNQIFSCFPLVIPSCAADVWGGSGVVMSAELYVSEVQFCSLWIHASPHAPLNAAVLCVQCLHFQLRAVCHLKLFWPVFVCIFVYTSLCAVVSCMVWGKYSL